MRRPRQNQGGRRWKARGSVIRNPSNKPRATTNQLARGRARERLLTHNDAMANFATLESLKKEDEEKEKKGNAYYAGGARGAGQGGRFVMQQFSFPRACNAALSWQRRASDAEEPCCSSSPLIRTDLNLGSTHTSTKDNLKKTGQFFQDFHPSAEDVLPDIRPTRLPNPQHQQRHTHTQGRSDRRHLIASRGFLTANPKMHDAVFFRLCLI